MASGLMAVAVIAFLAVQSPIPAGAVRSDTYDWYRGADGYNEAAEKARAQEKPLIIFFHVDWCGFCSRFQKEYLDERSFYDLLGDYFRVDINPEKGEEEKAIAQKYGLSGYPFFLVTYPEVKEFKKINPFRKSGNDLTVEEIIREFEGDVAWVYNQQAFGVLNKGDPARSAKLFNRALEHAPENATAYFGLGSCYFETARKNKAWYLLQKAEEYLVKAVDINADLDQAKKELARVREAIGKAGKN